MPNTTVVGIIFPYILTPIPNLYDHSFPRYGQITFLTFRRPTTLTFDLKFWKYLSGTVYPYVIGMPSFIMIGWEMAEILHIEILRKHGQTHTQTDRQTDRHGHYNTSPSPYGGRGNKEIKLGQYADDTFLTLSNSETTISSAVHCIKDFKLISGLWSGCRLGYLLEACIAVETLFYVLGTSACL